MDCTFVDLPFPCVGSGVPRSSPDDTGLLHMTDVIRSIEARIGRPRSGNFEDLNMAADVGFMWEDTLTRVMADRIMGQVFRPGEVIKDGIVCSPDGVGPDPLGVSHMVLEEYKFTWQSNRRSPVEVWYWMAQCMGYCYALGLDTVIMRIAYVLGDYKGSGPRYREARIVYTEQELWGNWRMIISHADEMRKEGRTR